MRNALLLVVGALVLSACGSSEDENAAGDGTSGVDGGDASAAVLGDGGKGGPGPSDAGSDGAPRDAAAADAAPPVTYSGEATYYNADGTGACGFKPSADLNVAAMNQAQYKKSLCGQCVHVKGPKGEVTVRIVDLCPGCSQGDLDLSEQAFSAISPLSAGRVKIQWFFTPCP